MKRLIGTALCALMAVAASIPMSAGAHTAVSDSNPKDGSTVEVVPEEVWVKFGSLPLSISDGRLEVVDACGTFVHNGETEMNETQDTLTVAAQGTVAGRYEIHWYATAMDGAAQSGVVDFVSSGGSVCKKVVRSDPVEDVSGGIDVTSVSSKIVRKKPKVTVTAASKITCKSLAVNEVALGIDTNSDDITDIEGSLLCKNGKPKIELSRLDAEEGEEAEETPMGTIKASLKKGKLAFVLSPKRLELASEDHIDLFVRTSTEADCTENCSDQAPDLGVLRAL